MSNKRFRRKEKSEKFKRLIREEDGEGRRRYRFNPEYHDFDYEKKMEQRGFYGRAGLHQLRAAERIFYEYPRTAAKWATKAEKNLIRGYGRVWKAIWVYNCRGSCTKRL